MSGLDSAVAENFLFDNTVAKNNLDANNYAVKSRNISPIIDQQRGNGDYKNGKIIIDAQSFGNSGSDLTAWSEAYITLPYRITLKASAGTTSTVATHDQNMLTALKNNSLIESLKVEQAGRVIINETANLSHLINFIKHCTSTQESLETQTCVNAYYPDGEFSTSVSAGIKGVQNQSNLGNGANIKFNDGLYKRQRALYPLNSMGAGAFSSTTNQASEYSTFQSVATPVASITGAAAAVNLSDIHFIAVIYLRDLSDYFAKHPLSRGLGYKITLGCNQAVSTITTASTTTPFGTILADTTLTASVPNTGSTVQPAMLTIGPNTINAPVVGGTASVYTFTLTSAIDTDTDNTRQQGVILNIPSYVLSEEYDAKLYQSPVIYRSPFLINSAVYTGCTFNNPINLQLFSAISNPRTLIVIPSYDSTAQGQTSPMSPFNTSPATTDVALSLTRIQLRVNSRPVLPSNSNYAFQQFIDNTSRIFGINGGESNVSSGVISLSKFMSNYRYYAFDLTQSVDPSQRDVPQLITFEGFNNSLVNVQLNVFVLYEVSASFDVIKGAVDIV